MYLLQNEVCNFYRGCHKLNVHAKHDKAKFYLVEYDLGDFQVELEESLFIF